VPGPSANGTFVNSHKLAPGEVVDLSEGDIVRVGRTELMFKSLWLSPSGRGRT
jgi:pSer/pThr/pTyr-binding forkhead associated (FHA) protein